MKVLGFLLIFLCAFARPVYSDTILPFEINPLEILPLPRTPIQFAEEVREETVKIFKISRSDAEQKRVVGEYLEKYLDLDYIVRFALGTHWDSMSDRERLYYRDQLKYSLFPFYMSFLADYVDASVVFIDKGVITESRPGITPLHEIVIRVTPETEPPFNITVHLANVDGRFKVRNVRMPSGNLLVQARSELGAQIRRDNPRR